MLGKMCFKCKNHKPISEFYAHPRMADGRLNKCKECTKRDVQRRYEEKPEAIADYERRRSRQPERKAKAMEYQRTSRMASPEKNAARARVANAIRRGKLARGACEVCGSDQAEAHHEDYSRPLDVRWLCFAHHRMAHGQRPNLAS